MKNIVIFSKVFILTVNGFIIVTFLLIDNMGFVPNTYWEGHKTIKKRVIQPKSFKTASVGDRKLLKGSM